MGKNELRFGLYFGYLLMVCKIGFLVIFGIFGGFRCFNLVLSKKIDIIYF